jgi:uncharacterized membrane protein
MQLIMVGVPNREIGLEALDRLDDAVSAGTVTVEDAALVSRNEKGKVKIHQTKDLSASRGGLWGGGIGLLVGLAAPPLLAATAVGAGAGALVAKARDRGVSDKLMKQVGGLIEESEAAVFILADESSTATITATLDELIAGGANASYEVMPGEAQDFMREAIKLGAAGG